MANFASIFLPNIHHDFIIFGIITASVTIFTFLCSLQWATPWSESILLFILGILWLTMGAWSTDVIGPTQCDGIDRHTQTPSKSGTSASLILLLIAHEQLTSARICSELAFLLLSDEGYPSFFLDHLLLVCDRILHPLAACQPSKEVREVSYLE
ncbi:hypothetical protein BJ165DRAFT_1421474 [Panaeolus papilionaceus]|nr:hypothetical protein BJ165DRAFT_1421474 [Panaeolus papilionaceus]